MSDDKKMIEAANLPKDEPRPVISVLSLGAIAALMGLGGSIDEPARIFNVHDFDYDLAKYRSNNNQPRVNKYQPHVGEKQKRKALRKLKAQP